MGEHRYDVVVVGCGIAGLSAAVSASAEGARVALLERTTREERGGQTRYTEAFLRMKSEIEVTDDFEDHFAANIGGHLDPSLIAESVRPYEEWPPLLRSLSFADPEVIGTLAREAPRTIQWLKGFGVRFDFLPTPFHTRSQPRLLPVGGGLAMVEALASQAEESGVGFFYESTARDLIQNETGAVIGVRTAAGAKQPDQLYGEVVLACGGFEGNPEMLTRYIGAHAIYLRPVARGGYYNKGEGIEMALRIGAASCGDFSNYHAEPIDPRSGATEPAIFIFPYGIVVNRNGSRFADEAARTVDAGYEKVTREIARQPGGIGYCILDAKIGDVPNYRKAVRSDVPPVVADTLDALAEKLGIPAAGLAATVAAYNAACGTGEFKPLELDGVATIGLSPQKSNWARPIDTGPFMAYPMVSANVFTFGGLKTNSAAQVVDRDGNVIPGLYAAGELSGIYYGDYTGATSVLRGAVYGRLAGLDAARRSRECQAAGNA